MHYERAEKYFKGFTRKKAAPNSPVTKPSAQIAKLLPDKTSQAKELEFIAKVFEQLKRENLRYYFICRILYLTGSRISEVLSLNCSGIDRSGGVVIHGKKGGSNKYFIDSEVSPWLLKLRECEGAVFYGITRFQIYKSLIRFGFKFKTNPDGNNKVTHYFRHLYTARLRSTNTDKETIKAELKHKSTKSQEHYGNYKKH